MQFHIKSHNLTQPSCNSLAYLAHWKMNTRSQYPFSLLDVAGNPSKSEAEDLAAGLCVCRVGGNVLGLPPIAARPIGVGRIAPVCSLR